MKFSLAAALSITACLLCLILKNRVEPHAQFRDRKELVLPVVDAMYYGQSLKRYSIGFDLLIADLVWIDLLQNASHAKLSRGKVSWEYAQLEAITTLDPHFMKAYSFGAAFLSVFRQDKQGAKRILQKWVQRDPSNWYSHYVYGYHLFYELSDNTAASSQILQAASLPNAPSWLTSLGIRVLSETGALTHALKLSVDLYSSVPNEADRNRILKQIRSLRFHIEKSAWEKALASFRTQRGQEPHDLEDLRPYIPIEERQLASIADPDAAPEELRPALTEAFNFSYSSHARSITSSKREKDQDLEQVGIYWNDATQEGKAKNDARRKH